MILEAHGGGWSGTFRGVIDWVARSAAAAHHEEPAAVALRIAQRISSSLQRENARAVLRRQALQDPEPQASWEGAADGETW